MKAKTKKDEITCQVILKIPITTKVDAEKLYLNQKDSTGLRKTKLFSDWFCEIVEQKSKKLNK